MLNIKKLENISIAIVGDYFLDQFIYVDVNRTSHSLYACGPAYYVNDVRRCAGAAGTVAKNLANLGIGHIYAIGFVGDDGNGVELRRSMGNLGIDCRGLVTTNARITPTYTMILHQDGTTQKEVCEYDSLNNKTTPLEMQEQNVSIISKLSHKNDLDAIIALDQLDTDGCCVITSLVAEALSSIGEKKLVYFDLRKHVGRVKNAIIKCNYKEFIESDLYNKSTTFKGSYEKVSKERGQLLIVTKDKDGSYIACNGELMYIPARKVKGTLDSRGTGDAFTSGFITAFCCGTPIYTAGLIGAVTASLCLTQIGTTGYMPLYDVVNTYERWCISDNL